MLFRARSKREAITKIIKRRNAMKIEGGPQVPKNLLEKLQAKEPDRDVAFTAIEELKDKAQIREFFQQYVELLKGAVEEDPEAVARQNIGYIVGYYNKETVDRWMGALPDVSHPVFGRDIPFYKKEK